MLNTALEFAMALGFGTAVLIAVLIAGALGFGLLYLLWQGWLWIWNHMSDPPRGGLERKAAAIGWVLLVVGLIAYFGIALTFLGGSLIEDIGWADYSWIDHKD